MTRSLRTAPPPTVSKPPSHWPWRMKTLASGRHIRDEELTWIAADRAMSAAREPPTHT
ncbi:hypothetical protein [Actinoplanes couchii]|uniref:Uncharacterized protein n=1 Tax=Actinoplanes couchii TaxID=403638 RepID=A0ABQ3XJ21_9ACTN|nr:hypothetical protein [Actinoplanes couchii]MDR6324498.1 hypothetical protein [Actinoplanes couchii]GID58502.1 hypothetical protein Aco03nite_069060 [Actinoplanes couchii]